MRFSRPQTQGTTTFAVGIVVFWFCGYASCMGLSQPYLKLVYPIVATVGMLLILTGTIQCTRAAARGEGKPGVGCMLPLMYGSLLISGAFYLLSVAVISGIG